MPTLSWSLPGRGGVAVVALTLIFLFVGLRIGYKYLSTPDVMLNRYYSNDPRFHHYNLRSMKILGWFFILCTMFAVVFGLLESGMVKFLSGG
jgi:hypothetical protein